MRDMQRPRLRSWCGSGERMAHSGPHMVFINNNQHDSIASGPDGHTSVQLSKLDAASEIVVDAASVLGGRCKTCRRCQDLALRGRRHTALVHWVLLCRQPASTVSGSHHQHSSCILLSHILEQHILPISSRACILDMRVRCPLMACNVCMYNTR